MLRARRNGRNLFGYRQRPEGRGPRSGLLIRAQKEKVNHCGAFRMMLEKDRTRRGKFSLRWFGRT